MYDNDKLINGYHGLSVSDIIETRHGPVRSRYPNEQMRRLLVSEAKLPLWRRLLRWVRGIR